MAHREQFSSPLRCPNCGREGEATWEENENPVHGGGYDRKLVSIPAGFERSSHNDRFGDSDILCKNCKVSACP